ncbi:hypothetical protein IMG5_182920 [Ichthyophthirius multifiliis]|uniref:Transmembrane protein n=1 Tax=Ichthyophthirius multifiliis TaxID=5932 RepID=G0R331_ICHMU|nr:hypothetical protein IMG5_182920 [Ichthyophthirius multifiliis]EGR28107.1 hypothetical protein IMG5_182920 [Ichthyophthirius multifiliis]|eukprot:XP_004027452.1 hypothetical protein IMG5_182920 [Ichthyophthirius multifiliis]
MYPKYNENNNQIKLQENPFEQYKQYQTQIKIQQQIPYSEDNLNQIVLSQNPLQEFQEYQKKQTKENKKENIIVIKKQKLYIFLILNNKQTKKIQNARKAINQINTIKKDLQNEDQKGNNNFQQQLINQKNNINIWIKLKVEQQIDNLLSKAKSLVKRKIKDPQMVLIQKKKKIIQIKSQCVKQLIDDAVDIDWPEIEDLVKIRIRIKEKQQIEKIQEIKQSITCYINPWYIIRSWYLYTDQPYNKSFWLKIRSFSWWFILLVKLFPFYGVQSFLHIIIFLFIDKSDEWQLFNYIIQFKKVQFFSIGMSGTLIGYALFFNCTTLNDYSSPQDFYKCKTEGPGSKINVIIDLLGFLLQIALCWLSFLIIPFSKSKGIAQKESNEYQNCCLKINLEKGGRFKNFLFLDMIAFFFCIGILMLFIYTGNDLKKEIWQYYQAIYLVKTIYGLLSFPWLLFLIEKILKSITKAEETGVIFILYYIYIYNTFSYIYIFLFFKKV